MKVGTILSECTHEPSFNRTLEELKAPKKLSDCSAYNRFNRTLEELKYYYWILRLQRKVDTERPGRAWGLPGTLNNHEEVLRILQKIKSGSQILEFLDPNYWDIYSDGKYISEFDSSLFEDLEVNIKVTTADKSLEIVRFDNKAIKKGKRSDKSVLKQVK